MTAKASGCESVSGSSRNDWGRPLSVRIKSFTVSESTASPTFVFTSTGTSTKFERTVRGDAWEAGPLSELSTDCSAVWAPTAAAQESPSKNTKTAFDRFDIVSRQLPACETGSITGLMPPLALPKPENEESAGISLENLL